MTEREAIEEFGRERPAKIRVTLGVLLGHVRVEERLQSEQAA
jgi:hypothetical protein